MDAKLAGNALMFEGEGAGEQVIYWPTELGNPEVKGNTKNEVRLNRQENSYRIYTYTDGKGVVEIRPGPIKE